MDRPQGKDFLDVAAELAQALDEAGIDFTIVGEAVCSIYTNNENDSGDIDFVSNEQYAKIEKALNKLGFYKDRGRNFVRRDDKYGDIRDSIFLDNVGMGNNIGEERIERNEIGAIHYNDIKIPIMTPTHTVMDRMLKYIYDRDMGALGHAVIIAKKYPVNLPKIQKWCIGELRPDAYEFFLARLKVSEAAPDDYSRVLSSSVIDPVVELAPSPDESKVHPWRLCPYGKHAVHAHPLHIEPSKKHPKGITTRHYHCAFNRDRKDVLYPFEMDVMAEDQFSTLAGPPKADDLGYGGGNAYDDFIRGWSKYWNDVLKPSDPLDPDLVKALIATESAFHPNSGIKPRPKPAKGLMQLTGQTTEILRNEAGELKEHFVNLSRSDDGNPNLNIAAGIRWLFRKRDTASAKVKRKATWDEAVADFKSYLDDMDNAQMIKFRKLYRRLKS